MIWERRLIFCQGVRMIWKRLMITDASHDQGGGVDRCGAERLLFYKNRKTSAVSTTD